MNTKISVIVPVFNVENYIERCMRSLLKQKLKRIEIILVDDGSTDRSPQICDQYAADYEYVKVIHKKNEGLGKARNSGLDMAVGEYIVFVDSDDYLADDALENLYNIGKKNNADTVLGKYKRQWKDGRIDEGQHPLENVLFSTHEDIMQNVLLNILGSPKEYYDDIYIMMSVWMGLYSRKIIQDNNIKFCSERDYISEDMIFDIDYYPCAKRVYISDCDFYFYCENMSSLTLTYKSNRFEKNKMLFKELANRCEKISLVAQERLDRSFIGRARQCIYSSVKNMPPKVAIDEIKSICKDDYLQSAIGRYPIETFTNKQRAFVTAMKYRRALLIYIVCKIFK